MQYLFRRRHTEHSNAVFQRTRAGGAGLDRNPPRGVSDVARSDETYETVRHLFHRKRTWSTSLPRSSAINGWNRLAISFRSVPGSYQPSKLSTTAEPAGYAPLARFTSFSSCTRMDAGPRIGKMQQINFPSSISSCQPQSHFCDR